MRTIGGYESYGILNFSLSFQNNAINTFYHNNADRQHAQSFDVVSISTTAMLLTRASCYRKCQITMDILAVSYWVTWLKAMH